jgi:fructokinase
METQKLVLAYGETLWDMLPNGAVLGGAPFNFCYRINSLGDRGLMVTRLGRDDLGHEAADGIVALRMDTRFVQWDDEAPTGTVRVDLTDRTDPVFEILPDVAYDNIEVTDELLEVAGSADCICFGTLAQRTDQGRDSCEALLNTGAGAIELLDLNLRAHCFTVDTVTWSLRRADVLKLNDGEARQVEDMLAMAPSSFPEFASMMIETWSLSHCVVTFGAGGAFVASADGQNVYVPGFKVEVVDTCGAGDAFAAGFIHKLLRGAGLAESCELGNALGAMVAMQAGATVPITLDAVRRFLTSEHERVVQPGLESYGAG